MVGSPFHVADARPPACQTRPRPGSRSTGRRADDPRARRAHAQPEEHRSRHPEEPAGRDHGPLGLGQIEPRVRHALCRRPAPLRREPLGIRAPVPAADGQARRRRDRRALAGNLDRAESHLAQPALDGRHRHRDPRLPAPAVRARRHAVLPEPRPGPAGAKRQPDGRRDAGPAGRHPAAPARAGGARPQGRVRRPVPGNAVAGLRALSRRRQDLRSGRRAEAEEVGEARHRRGDRPDQGAAGNRAARRRKLRSGPAHRRRARTGRGDRRGRRRRRHARPAHRRQSARAPVLEQVLVPLVRLLAARARAAPVLVQFADRRLPELRRPGRDHGVRRRARRRFPQPQPGQRRGEGLGPAQRLHLLAARKRRPPLRLRHRPAVRGSARERTRGSAARLRHRRHRIRLRGRRRARQAAPDQAKAPVRRHPAEPRAALQGNRFGRRARRPDALPERQALPRLRGRAPARRGAQRLHRRCEERREGADLSPRALHAARKPRLVPAPEDGGRESRDRRQGDRARSARG